MLFYLYFIECLSQANRKIKAFDIKTRIFSLLPLLPRGPAIPTRPRGLKVRVPSGCWKLATVSNFVPGTRKHKWEFSRAWHKFDKQTASPDAARTRRAWSEGRERERTPQRPDGPAVPPKYLWFWCLTLFYHYVGYHFPPAQSSKACPQILSTWRPFLHDETIWLVEPSIST
jgi:hypothetical protein